MSGPAFDPAGHDEPAMLQAAPIANDKLSKLGRAALGWARQGWFVFPLVPNGKKPLIAKEDGGHGYLDATRDEAQIRQWWTDCPNANIGGACGPSGKSVLDIDKKKGGLEPFNALMLEVGAEQFATWRHGTPGDGFHYIFAAGDNSIKNSESAIALGIDTRGYDGYIVLPPSRINGKRYTIEARGKDTLLLPFPAALRERLVRNGDRGDGNRIPGADNDERIPQGRRRDALKSLAGRLRRNGMNAAAIYDALVAVATRQCDPPYTTADELKDLQRLADDFAEYEPAHAMGADQNGGAAQADAEWGTLTEPVIPKITVPTLPLELLPAPLAPWIIDEAERMNVPLEAIAIPAMIALGSVLGSGVAIQPSWGNEGYLALASNWGTVIAPPGSTKTPAMNAALAPLYELQRKAREQYRNDNAAMEARRRI